MFQGKRAGAVLLMGGSGSRFGSDLPKQFHLLQGKPVYLHTLEIFLESSYFDEIVLVCPKEWIQKIFLPSPIVHAVLGGATRQESSWRGLQGFSSPPEIVAIHDAVRPFVTEAILKENLATALESGAADTCIASADTIVYSPNRKEIASIPNRAHYLRGQTPQTFRYDWIVDAHKKAIEKGIENASDDCRLVLEAGYPIQVVEGSETNLKITTFFDLELAEKIGQKQRSMPSRNYEPQP